MGTKIKLSKMQDVYSEVSKVTREAASCLGVLVDLREINSLPSCLQFGAVLWWCLNIHGKIPGPETRSAGGRQLFEKFPWLVGAHFVHDLGNHETYPYPAVPLSECAPPCTRVLIHLTPEGGEL